MAALVVTVSPANGMSDKEGRIEIFPGGPTTSMYPADAPFWVGYGFAPDAAGGGELEGEGTRFELEVDGVGVQMVTALHEQEGLSVRKTNVADFPDGLPAGWHDFSGRWYDAGRLILSSRVSIQFVER